jgi:hypothetical protein
LTDQLGNAFPVQEVGANGMGIQKLMSLERELDLTYTENVTINTDSSNPHHKEVLSMVGNRLLSLSLRKQMNLS